MFLSSSALRNYAGQQEQEDSNVGEAGSQITAEHKAWHLDVKVMLTLIIALFTNSATIVWWASGIESRMAFYEQRISNLEQNTKELPTMIARLEEQTRYQNSVLARIDAKLDRLEDQQSGNVRRGN